MENKYYTPEIEEFHVGFEYEVKGLKGWDKRIVSSSQDILEMEELMMRSLNPYRVKYLDREDIESFSEGVTNRGLFILKDSEFDYKRIVCVLTKSNFVLIGNDSKGDAYNQLFVGKIKNKSELKKLLKQLNINENNELFYN